MFLRNLLNLFPNLFLFLDMILALAVSPTCRRVVTAGNDGSIGVINIVDFEIE